MSHGSDSIKSIFFALGANLAIAIPKLIAAIVTGSGSMMAESIHYTGRFRKSSAAACWS